MRFTKSPIFSSYLKNLLHEYFVDLAEVEIIWTYRKRWWQLRCSWAASRGSGRKWSWGCGSLTWAWPSECRRGRVRAELLLFPLLTDSAQMIIILVDEWMRKTFSRSKHLSARALFSYRTGTHNCICWRLFLFLCFSCTLPSRVTNRGEAEMKKKNRSESPEFRSIIPGCKFEARSGFIRV